MKAFASILIPIFLALGGVHAAANAPATEAGTEVGTFAVVKSGGKVVHGGYGGHFRAVQGFRYIEGCDLRA